MTKSIKAMLRSHQGCVNEVQLLDLSVAGCLIENHALRIKADDRILLKMGELSYRPARVLWIEEDRAGLEFEAPLYLPVISHLKRGLADQAA